jgi:ACR3 family arsenite efflux pump ArsB
MTQPVRCLAFFERYLSVWVLACVVGVLVEVPVMLSVCRGCNASRGWYQRALEA